MVYQWSTNQSSLFSFGLLEDQCFNPWWNQLLFHVEILQSSQRKRCQSSQDILLTFSVLVFDLSAVNTRSFYSIDPCRWNEMWFSNNSEAKMLFWFGWLNPLSNSWFLSLSQAKHVLLIHRPSDVELISSVCGTAQSIEFAFKFHSSGENLPRKQQDCRNP